MRIRLVTLALAVGLGLVTAACGASDNGGTIQAPTTVPGGTGASTSTTVGGTGGSSTTTTSSSASTLPGGN